MKIKLKALTISILSVSMFSPISSFAGEWGIGLNVNNNQDTYRDHEDSAQLTLFPEYRGERFNMDFESMSYRLFDSKKYNLEILGKASYLGYEEKDSDRLLGMKDRDPSINLGLRASYVTDYGLFSIHALTDILGKHKGQEIELQFGEPFYTSHWSGKRELTLGFLGGLRWQSDDLINYYYGVKESEATATRAAFKGKSAITPFVGFEAKVGLTKHFSVDSAITYEHLPNDITDSPIASDNGIRARLGLTYWF